MHPKLKSVAVGVVMVAAAVGIGTPAVAVSPPPNGGPLQGLCQSARSDVTYSNPVACAFADETARETFASSVQGQAWVKLCGALYGGTLTFYDAADGFSIVCTLP